MGKFDYGQIEVKLQKDLNLVRLFSCPLWKKTKLQIEQDDADA
jgi:hypothetical protein